MLVFARISLDVFWKVSRFCAEQVPTLDEEFTLSKKCFLIVPLHQTGRTTLCFSVFISLILGAVNDLVSVWLMKKV